MATAKELQKSAKALKKAAKKVGGAAGDLLLNQANEATKWATKLLNGEKVPEKFMKGIDDTLSKAKEAVNSIDSASVNDLQTKGSEFLNKIKNFSFTAENVGKLAGKSARASTDAGLAAGQATQSAAKDFSEGAKQGYTGRIAKEGINSSQEAFLRQTRGGGLSTAQVQNLAATRQLDVPENIPEKPKGLVAKGKETFQNLKEANKNRKSGRLTKSGLATRTVKGLTGLATKPVIGVSKVAGRFLAPVGVADAFNGIAVRMGEGMTLPEAVGDGLLDTGASLVDFASALAEDPEGTWKAMNEGLTLGGLAEDAAIALAKGAWNIGAGAYKGTVEALGGDASNVNFMDPGADGIKFLPSDSEISKRLEKAEEYRKQIVEAKMSGDVNKLNAVKAEQQKYKELNNDLDGNLLYGGSDTLTPSQLADTPKGLQGGLPKGVREVSNPFTKQQVFAGPEGFSDAENIATLNGGKAAPLPKNLDSIVTGDSRGVAGLNISAAAQKGRADALGVTAANAPVTSADALNRKIAVDSEFLASISNDPELSARVQASIDNDIKRYQLITRGLGKTTDPRSSIRADAKLTPEEARNNINAGVGNASDNAIYNSSLSGSASEGFTDKVFGRTSPDAAGVVTDIQQNNHPLIPFLDNTTNVTYADGRKGTYENLTTEQQNVLNAQKNANKARLGL